MKNDWKKIVETFKMDKSRLSFTFLTTFLIGIIAHGFMFTNSFSNRDNIRYFMNVGGTWKSGRWFLGVLKNINSLLFGTSASVPWLIGIVGVVWLSLSACLLVQIFDAKSKVAQLLLGMTLITFPSVTATYTYMFTSAYYFFAVFLVVSSAFFATQEGTKRTKILFDILSVMLLAFSLGIYQAYFGFGCCLFAIYILYCIFLDVRNNSEEKSMKIVKDILRFSLILLLSFVLYYALNAIVLAFFNSHMDTAHISSAMMQCDIKDVLNNAVLCYKSIIDILLGDFYGISNVRIFRVTFAVCIIFMVCICIRYIWRLIKRKKYFHAIIIFMIMLILPLGINLVFLLTGSGGVHTLMVYPVVTVFLVPLLLGNCSINKTILTKSLLYLMLLLTGMSNILQANKAYVKLDMANQYAHSYLTTLITQIKSLEGYQDGMPVLFIGSVLNREDSTFSGNERGWNDVENIMGVFDAHLMANPAFLEYFCATRFETPENYEDLNNSDVVQQMPCYPDYGSIIIYENVVLVKLSESGEEK